MMSFQGGFEMKKLCLLFGLVFLLAGCGAEETFETMSDVFAEEEAKVLKISVDMPQKTMLPAMECEGGALYFCDNWEIAVQTLAGGDWDRTVRAISGYSLENLTVMETGEEKMPRMEFVWTTAGERGDRVGRAAIISDGHYHYCLSVLADADQAGELAEIWNGMFESFSVA